jgi:hypothetical protein
MDREPCPGCGALFPRIDGPTHPYIGASAGCWALFTPVAAGAVPDPQLVEQSAVPRRSMDVTPHAAAPGLSALLADAYAAQHHGEDSSQAIQSVAVHLLTMYGVLRGRVAPEHAQWPRRRGLRRRGVFHKLTPPPVGAALTVRHLFPGGGVDEPITVADYVASVFAAWEQQHGALLAEWYDTFVLAE